MMRLQRSLSLIAVASGMVLVACSSGSIDGGASGSGGEGAGASGVTGSGATTGQGTGTATSSSGSSGSGDPNSPSTPADFHMRLAASRANYYHDGTHMFEPQFVNEDPALEMVAQDYASKYAAGQVSPNGMIYDNSISGYEPYWDGTYQGYRAVAGMETPTSCNCPLPDPNNPRKQISS